MKKIFSTLFAAVLALGLNAETATLINYNGEKAVTEGVTLSGTTVMASVKIHTNKDAVDCIQLKNGYTTDAKYNNNSIILKTEGGFKAGDVLALTGFFSNDDDTKVAKAELFTVDAEGKCTAVWTSEQFINGKKVDDEPNTQSYTLEADMDSILIGRNGNTGTNFTKIVVTREAAATFTVEENEEGIITITPSDLTAKYAYLPIPTGIYNVNATYNPEFTPESFMSEYAWEMDALMDESELLTGVQTIDKNIIATPGSYTLLVAYGKVEEELFTATSSAIVYEFVVENNLPEFDATVSFGETALTVTPADNTLRYGVFAVAEVEANGYIKEGFADNVEDLISMMAPDMMYEDYTGVQSFDYKDFCMYGPGNYYFVVCGAEYDEEEYEATITTQFYIKEIKLVQGETAEDLIYGGEVAQKIVVEQSEIAIYDWAAPEYNINTMAYPTDWTFQLTIVAEEGLAEGEYELGEFDNVADANYVSHNFVAGSKITLTKGTAWTGGDCWIITGELETIDGLILDITLSTEPAKADVDLDKIVSENATVVCNFRSEKWSIEAETEAATLRLQFASSEYEGIYTVDTWGFGYDNLLVYGEDAADDIKAGSITAVVEGENVHVTGWVILHSYDTEMTYYVPVDLKGAAVEEDPAEGDELSDLTVTLNKVNMEDDGWALNFSASNEEGYELVLQFSWGVALDENDRLPEGELPITADQDIDARIIPSIEIPQGGFGPGPLSLEDEGEEVAVPDGSYITDGEKFWFLYEGSATISYNEDGKLLMVINAKNTAGNTLTITIDETAGGAKVYEVLYEIGDNQAWNPAEAIEMTMLEENVFQGEFTFTNESNWFAFTTVKTSDWAVVNANRFGSNPSGAEVKGDQAPVAITGIDGDYSFTIAAGTYTITVDLNEMNVSAEQTLGVENTKANGAAVKVLRGAQVIIVRDGAEYTILGNAL